MQFRTKRGYYTGCPFSIQDFVVKDIKKLQSLLNKTYLKISITYTWCLKKV